MDAEYLISNVTLESLWTEKDEEGNTWLVLEFVNGYQIQVGMVAVVVVHPQEH